MTTILDAPDMDATIESPLGDETFDLDLDERLRRVWHASGIASVDYDEYTIQEPDEEGGERDPKTAIWWLYARLGEVRAFRRTARGVERELEKVTVRLRIERFDDDGAHVEVDSTRGGERPRRWSAELTELFHGIVRSLCDGSYPPKPAAGLRAKCPENTAAALVREGWGTGGDDVTTRNVEHWWRRGLRIDLARFLADVEKGSQAGKWGVVRTDAGTRLLWPLVLEGFEARVAHAPKSRWLVTRYWLAIDLDAQGRLDEVAVRTDRDGTWDAEGDDDGDDDGDEAPLSEIFSEEGYSAMCEVLDYVRDDEDAPDDDAG